MPAPASQGQLRSARRLLRRKGREQAGRFLVDGRQAVREALGRPGTVESLLVADDVAARQADLLALAAEAGVAVSAAPARAVAELSDAVTPQGIVALCRVVDVGLGQVLGDPPRLLLLGDRIRDPGNLGAVIRCADAFGADAVLVSRESVELYNPKTVRATTGSLFHLPIVVEVDPAAAVQACRSAGLQVLAADGSGADDLTTLTDELTRPTVWLMGNEAWGLAAEDVRLADRVVRVPIYGRAESLNLATAAAVCLYASATAQRTGRG